MARGQGGMLVVTDLWTISRGYRRILAWAAPILISCALGQLALADSSPNRTTIPSSDAFDILAEQILAGIGASDKLPAYESGARDDRPRIAVWPFSAGNAPVPAGLANEYNAKLILALLDKGGDRYRFIARDTLEAVVKEISESGAHEDEIDDLLAALVKSAKADVLVVGKLRRATVREVVLSYEAVRVDDGTILAATSHHRIHIDPLEADTAWTPPTRDPETQADSRRHAKGAPDQTEPYLRDPEVLWKIPPAPPPQTSHGTTNPLVVETIQEDLMILGYDPGPVDGVLGARTAAAIRAYQIDSGLPIDGRITVRLVDSLRQSVERHIAARPRREPMASRPTLPIGYDSRRPFCREYEQRVMIGGIEQRGYGKACLQPDGVWKVVR